MNDESTRRFNAWHLGYAGFAAAMLPGITFAALGPKALLVGIFASATILGSFVSIRAALRDLMWYRLYMGLVFSLTAALGFAVVVYPGLKEVAAGVWFLAAIATHVAFLEHFEETHDKPIAR